MWKTVLLIIPVLVPSWRFFKAIEPSPRVQWALFKQDGALGAPWTEYRPRPPVLPLWQMVCRLFWNPAWNETLFLVSCAERIQECPTDHSINEIRRRILREIMHEPDGVDRWMQFRLVFVKREDGALFEDVVFVSQMYPVDAGRRP